MMKFRMTNSMKARRAAEGQRKALEEKLKMEWAWKPMAAIMNEKETDLVYWVPPIYTSRFLDSLASTASSTIGTSPYSSKRSSLTNPSAPSTPMQARRRKLAQRRAKLTARQNSIQEVQSDTNEEDQSDAKRKKEDIHTDEDRESGIQDEFLDSSLEEDIIADDSFNRTNRLKHSLKKLDRPPNLPPPRKERFRHLPTLLKVINKLSHIYTLPTSPRPPMYGCSAKSFQEKEVKAERKPKRPSVKIYRVPSTRSSIRKKNISEEDQPFYAISNNKYPFGGSKKRFSLRSQDSTTSERTHIGLPMMTESELRKAHLEMILKILTNLYEEKLIIQNTEIAQLKSKLFLQEKVVKQTAHLVLDMKEQIRTLQAKYDFNEDLKVFYKNNENDPESSFEYQRLEPLVEETTEMSKNQISSSALDDSLDDVSILHANSEQSEPEGENLHRQVARDRGNQGLLRYDSLKAPRKDSCESLRQYFLNRSPRKESYDSFRQDSLSSFPRKYSSDSYRQDSLISFPRKYSSDSYRQDSLTISSRQNSCDSFLEDSLTSSPRKYFSDFFRQDSREESYRKNSFESESSRRDSSDIPRREYVRQMVRQLEPSCEPSSDLELKNSSIDITSDPANETHISVLKIKIT